MSSEFGKNIKITVFGQSHSKAIGVVIDGLPAGEKIDRQELRDFMRRRAPGGKAYATARTEADEPVFLAGLVDDTTCGAPLCAIIENTDTRSEDYDRLRDVPRPSHADYPAAVKHDGYNDIRGGGHFSGRLTASLCVAGGICKQLLERRGIVVGAHIAQIGEIADTPFDPVVDDIAALTMPGDKAFSTVSEDAGERMQQAIVLAKQNGDSLGGIVECKVIGLPVGLGAPMFDGLENRLAAAVFGIPAVKGIEFGSGFEGAMSTGSRNNDAFITDNGTVKTVTNRHGGILGGLSTGMPLMFRAAFKPTASIALEQQSVSLSDKTPTALTVEGRHDPCIVPRAVAVVEAVAAAVLYDFIMDGGNTHGH